MADDDTQPTQPAAPAPGSMSGYLNDPTVQRLLQQITNPAPPQLPAPPARVSSDGTRPGWLSLLGEGLGGGQSPLYHLSGSAEDAAGSRSLLNFGIGMLMASGPQRVRPGLGQIFGSGLQAAQESMDASQKAAFTQAGQQFQQQKDLASLGLEQQKAKIEQLNAILPLLKLNALQNQPPLYGNNTSGQPPAGGGGTGSQPASPDRAAFTASFTPTAQAISAKTGLPVDYVIAQAGLETGWGTSNAYKNNNAFGISDGSGKPLSYNSPAEGAQAYIDLMNSDRYKNVARDGTPQQIGDRMALAGYNPNVPKKDSTDSYGARIGAFAAPAAAPPATAGTPAPYKVATAGPVPPPPSSTAPAPVGGDLVGPRPLPPTGPGSPVVTPAQIANTPVPVPGAPPGVVAPAPALTPTTNPPAVVAPQPTTMATSAPTPPPTVDLKSRPDTELNPEEYIQKHWVPLTPEQVRTYAPGPDGAVAAAAADQVQRAKQQVMANETQLNQIRGGLIQGDVNKAAAQVNDANKELDAAENAYNTTIHSLQSEGAKNLLAADDQQRQQLRADYKASVLDPRNKATELTQQGEQAIKLEQAKGQTASETKVMDGLNEMYEAARTGKDQIGMARAFSQAAGDPTFWQQVQTNHPDLVRWLANTGVLTENQVNQLGYAGAMDAAMNKLIASARVGTGFQRMSNLDVQILRAQAPEGTDPQQWREAKMAYLEGSMDRQKTYVETVRSLRADGVPLYDAQKRAETLTPDAVPQIPNFTDQPGGKTAVQQRIDWANANVPMYTFFRGPDGKSLILRKPPTQAQSVTPGVAAYPGQ